MLILGAVLRHTDRGTLQQIPSHTHTHTHRLRQGEAVAEAQRDSVVNHHTCAA